MKQKARLKPANGEIYHVYNRGVDKRKVFLDDDDRFRFIHDLYEFNDKNPAANIFYRNAYEVRLRKRELLVEILSFCLMPNHFHLELRQIADDGISEFMRKIGTGYTNYFNHKYSRSGVLFQGKYKMIIMEKESQFGYLPFYIHFNPLKIIFPKWKEKGVGDVEKAMSFLENYRWSSYLDFIGKKNFPSVTSSKFISDYAGKASDYRKEIKDILTKSDFVRMDELQPRAVGGGKNNQQSRDFKETKKPR